MRIALVLAAPPGYSETFFNSKIKGLQENGHEVILFTGPSQETYTACTHIKSPEVHKYLLIQLLKVCLIGVQLLRQIKVVRRYFKLERKHGCTIKRAVEKIYLNSQLLKFKGDWLHYGFATLALERELVAEAIGVKMAVSFRGFDINVYPTKHPNCYDLLWKQVNKIHSISTYLLNRAYLIGLYKSTPYQIIYPAVDVNNLPKRTSASTGTPIKILTIARFNWIKGIDYLIEVAACLKQEKMNFEWHLIGSGNNFENERYLYHIHETELDNHILLKGRCSHKDTLKMLSAADVYVQTSLNEGFCNAVLEAQAIGVPCVAFGVGGLPENICDKKTGWLVKPFDVEDMAKKIMDIYHLSIKEKTRISEQAIKRVQEEFSLEEQSQAFQEFYSNR